MDGGGEAGVQGRSGQEQAGLCFSQPRQLRGPSAFLSNRLLPSVPEAGGQGLCPVQGMGF